MAAHPGFESRSCQFLAFLLKSTQLCGLAGVRLQLAVPPVQYERRIVKAGFCGGFVAQWFMAALVRHPGFESRTAVAGFSLFSFLSQQAGFQLNVRICHTPAYIHMIIYDSRLDEVIIPTKTE